jgi:hypothetical protein
MAHNEMLQLQVERCQSGSMGLSRKPAHRLSRYRTPQARTTIRQNVLASYLDHLFQRLDKAYPDLATVLSAWPALPEPLKAGIVVMVKAAGKQGG